MGEAKQKSLNREEVLKRDERCTYCMSLSVTWDHMPPKAMFKCKNRPSGMEYGSCESCNNGTRTSDAIAAFIAHATIDTAWKAERSEELLKTIIQQEPNFRTEFFRVEKRQDIYLPHPSGRIAPAKKVRVDGPIAIKHLTAFSAKLGMALFREHIGKPMSQNSGVYMSWFGTPTRDQTSTTKSILEKMPYKGELRQGKKQFDDQFVYCYFTAEDLILAATIKFHESLHINVVAVEDLAKPHLEASAFNGLIFVKFGELLKIVG